MKDKPIIFSGESVRAIMAGQKTQTRRVINPQPPEGSSLWSDVIDPTAVFDEPKGFKTSIAPLYGNPVTLPVVEEHVRKCPLPEGTQLWVRETWAAHFIWSGCSAEEMFGAFGGGTCLFYQADGDDAGSATGGCASHQREKTWRSPLFMPRWASRLTLEVINVRVERVQDISEADAKAEGVEPGCLTCGENCLYTGGCGCCRPAYQDSFIWSWDALNAKRGYSWESNPWVWVYEFKVVEPTP